MQSSQTRKGKGRAAHALRLAAWGLMRSTSYLGAYLRRQRSRLGSPKAVTATAHKLARVVYHLTGPATVRREPVASGMSQPNGGALRGQPRLAVSG